MNRGIKQYANVSKTSGIESATPYQLITMLYDGALNSLSTAKGCLERKDFIGKGQHLGRAITIVGGLQNFLDMEKGGDIAKNLDMLYDYITRILFDATVQNDIKKVEEAINLIRTVKEGWDGIAEQVNRAPSVPGFSQAGVSV